MRGFYQFNPEDAKRFGREQGIRFRQRGDELQFQVCPYCRMRTDDKNTFSINLTTGQFKCLRASCNVSGNMITLAREFGFSLGSYVDAYYSPRMVWRKFRNKEMPESKPPAIEYMLSRKISEEITRKYNITSRKDNDKILVFPFYDDNGELVFIKYRNTEPKEGQSKEFCEKNCKPILFGMNHCDPAKNDTLVLTEGQCFGGDAEIMTPDGWCKLEDYKGDKVLQIKEDMTAEFVKPKSYIVKRHQGKMVDVEIGGNYFTSTTNDHNLVFVMKSGKVIKKKAGEKISTAYHIPTAIEFDAGGVDWTNDEIALYLAISADGSLNFRKNTYHKKSKTNTYVRFGLTKERKVERLKSILDRLGYEYSDSILDKQNGQYHSICFGVPDKFNSKFLPWWFVTETSLEQKKFIIEEMVWWDGNHVNGRNQYEYQSIYKHNVDVIQAVASTCGYMSTVRQKESGGNGAFKKGFLYKASVLLRKNSVSTQQFEAHKRIYDVNKNVYCVTVDSGMILVRQNNRVSVSGNCDTLACAEAGIENAVSVPTGAKGFTWVPHCWDFLGKFNTLIVFGDHERGQITLLDEMKGRFNGAVKHVREEDYKDCKDANEILQKYGKEAVKSAVENAVLVENPRIKNLADVRRKSWDDVPHFDSGIADFDKMSGGLFLGQLIVLTGERGLGKSTLASQIGISALDNGYSVFFYSGELNDWQFQGWFERQIAGPNHINKRRLDNDSVKYSVDAQFEYDIVRWYSGRALIYDNQIIANDDDEDETLLETIECAVTQYGCKVIFVDNLMTAMTDDVQTDLYRQQSNFVKQLSKMAKVFEVLIVLIAHPRKSDATNFGNDDIAGSSNITNLADIVMRYGRNSDKKADKSSRVLQVLKNRMYGWVHGEKDGIALYYDDASKRISENANYFGWHLGWEKKGDGFTGSGVDYDEVPFD